VSTPTQITDTDKLNLLERIPYEVIQLLYDFNNEEVVKNLGRGAFLAGGAVRDGLLGKPIKDWDIYFPYLGANNTLSAYDISTYFDHTWSYQTLSKTTKVSEYPDQYKVFEFWKMLPGDTNNTVIQLIFSGQDISDFDKGICQCALDLYPEMNIRTSKSFDACVRHSYHEVFMDNLINEAMLKKSLLTHVPRITAKYPWPVFLRYGML
jgi:hypothetical protein